jgi:hypothetical protein
MYITNFIWYSGIGWMAVVRFLGVARDFCLIHIVQTSDYGILERMCGCGTCDEV